MKHFLSMGLSMWLAVSAGAVTLAYRDPGGSLVYKAEGGELKVVAAKDGYEPCLSPDGKRLLYTRSVGDKPERTLVLYESATGKSRDLMSGLVRQARWSPDATRIAFLKLSGDQWQVWTMPAVEPSKAALVSQQPVEALMDWMPNGKGIVAAGSERFYWMNLDGRIAQTIVMATIYDKEFQWMSSDWLRLNPKDPDLLVGSAYYLATPRGSPVDAMDLNASVFNFDLTIGKRKVLLSTTAWGHEAQWSPDGEWIYFTRREQPMQDVIWRMRPDGSGLEKVVAGSEASVAQ